jgi:NTE family protein
VQALVLSGGNIKGAFQAGAVRALLRAGYRPDIVTGISVGALNGGFLVSRAGKPAGPAPDWPGIGDALVDFWHTRVTGPDVVLRPRGWLDLGLRLLRGKWDGLADMHPLYRLVQTALASGNLAASPVRCAFGAVSIDTGAIVYSPVDPGTAPALVAYIIASTQEPVGMQLYPIGGQWFYDGGLRDLAPLKPAIRLGADRIVCVACQADDVGPTPPGFNRGDAMALVGRVTEIVTNELLNGDLETLMETNDLLREAGPVPTLAGKRVIPLLVVRPDRTIDLDIRKFTTRDIDGMVKQGAERTRARILSAQADPNDPGHAIATGLNP